MLLYLGYTGLTGLTQAKERQHQADNNDQADDINDGVHDDFFQKVVIGDALNYAPGVTQRL